MFVNKKTALPVELHRTHVRDGVFVAAVVVTVAYPLGTVEPEPARKAKPPADWHAATRRALWSGASVTAQATARNPDRRRPSASVRLRVGATTRTLSVTGDRQWIRRGRDWLPTPAAPWDSMPICWSLAFGGSAELPPGPHGPGGLPHPGGRGTYPWNPGGKGFSLGEAAAEGQPLPNIEWADDLVRSPLDRPRPAGLAPCPALIALRLPERISAPEDPPPVVDIQGLMSKHVAPRELLFERVEPGTDLDLDTGAGTVARFTVPASPVHASVRRGNLRTEIPARIRSIHVDADRQVAWVSYGHGWSYTSPATWVDVTEG